MFDNLVKAIKGTFSPNSSNPKLSKEPWVTITSAEYDEVKGIRLQFDWNDAFITYLKDQGIVGVDEDAVVQRWVAMLAQDVAAKQEQSNKQGSTNEFD